MKEKDVRSSPVATGLDIKWFPQGMAFAESLVKTIKPRSSAIIAVGLISSNKSIPRLAEMIFGCDTSSEFALNVN
jgi:hypothetical protein